MALWLAVAQFDLGAEEVLLQIMGCCGWVLSTFSIVASRLSTSLLCFSSGKAMTSSAVKIGVPKMPVSQRSATGASLVFSCAIPTRKEIPTSQTIRVTITRIITNRSITRSLLNFRLYNGRSIVHKPGAKRYCRMSIPPTFWRHVSPHEPPVDAWM